MSFSYPQSLVLRNLVKGDVVYRVADDCRVLQSWHELLATQQLLRVVGGNDVDIVVVRQTRLLVGARLRRWDAFSPDVSTFSPDDAA